MQKMDSDIESLEKSYVNMECSFRRVGVCAHRESLVACVSAPLKLSVFTDTFVCQAQF